MMDYLDALRLGGWVPDPTDRVRVVAAHADGCPAVRGEPCTCVPRLVLATGRTSTTSRDADDTDEFACWLDSHRAV